MQSYNVKYKDGNKVTGQLLAAAELRQAIIYNNFVFFTLREIRPIAKLVYENLQQYYDTKAECIKHLLTYRPRVHERLNIELLCTMLFNIDGVENMVYHLVEVLRHS